MKNNATVYPVGWVSPVPKSISMWQARQIMIDVGILDDVINILNSIPNPKERRKALDKLEYSSNMNRTDPLLQVVVAQLGKSEEEIDDMFIRASKLV